MSRRERWGEKIGETLRNLKARFIPPSIDLESSFGDDVSVGLGSPVRYMGVAPIVQEVPPVQIDDNVFVVQIEGRNKQVGHIVPVDLEMHAHVPPQQDDSCLAAEITDLLMSGSRDEIYYLFHLAIGENRGAIFRSVSGFLHNYPQLLLLRNKEQNTLIGYVLFAQERENEKWFTASAFIDTQFRRCGLLEQSLVQVLLHMEELGLPADGTLHFHYNSNNTALVNLYQKLNGQGGNVVTHCPTSQTESDKCITFANAKKALGINENPQA